MMFAPNVDCKMIDLENFEETERLIKENPDARVAGKENNIRNSFAFMFRGAMEEKKLNIKTLAKETGLSITQINRALQKELGGALHLKTIIKLSDFFNIGIKLTLGVNNG